MNLKIDGKKVTISKGIFNKREITLTEKDLRQVNKADEEIRNWDRQDVKQILRAMGVIRIFVEDVSLITDIELSDIINDYQIPTYDIPLVDENILCVDKKKNALIYDKVEDKFYIRNVAKLEKLHIKPYFIHRLFMPSMLLLVGIAMALIQSVTQIVTLHYLLGVIAPILIICGYFVFAHRLFFVTDGILVRNLK